MSFDNLTEEERTYLNDGFHYGCSRITSTILLTLVLYVAISSMPSPINIWVFIVLAVCSLIKISLGLIGWILGPGPEIPDSLKKEM